jgi:hypothetical protein
MVTDRTVHTCVRFHLVCADASITSTLIDMCFLHLKIANVFNRLAEVLDKTTTLAPGYEAKVMTLT